MTSSAPQFDEIVAGGGTAGAVIAARLSEDRGRRVLLLEAGPDYPDTIPPELLDASFAVTKSHNWDFQGILRDGFSPGNGQWGRINRVFETASEFLSGSDQSHQSKSLGLATSFPYLAGKVVGGGSAVNGCLALHARPEDYATWAAVGGDRWNWEQVQPYIARIATTDSTKPALPLETALPEHLTRCQRAFRDSCHVLGNRWTDLSQGTRAGVGTIPRNVRKGQRVSTSTLYLTAARGRKNLTIRSRCLVNRLLLEQRNGSLIATGVEALIDGVQCRFSGGHIIVSAGAINSPAILLRSGIGAAAETVRCDIEPLLDLPGVGKNLQDHSSVSIWGTATPGSCSAGEPVHQLMLQQKSKGSEELCDIQLYMLSAVRTDELPGLRQVAASDVVLGISVVLARPRSKGWLEFVSRDPTKSPHIYLNCLDESEDLSRMMAGVRSAWCILRREPLSLHVDRFLLWTQSIIESDAMLESLSRGTVRTTWHPAGTLRMGKEGDATAVVDQYGSLYGCRNITVADASIVPTIPSVPLNLTCMLIGERIAAHLRGMDE